MPSSSSKDKEMLDQAFKILDRLVGADGIDALMREVDRRRQSGLGWRGAAEAEDAEPVNPAVAHRFMGWLAPILTTPGAVSAMVGAVKSLFGGSSGTTPSS